MKLPGAVFLAVALVLSGACAARSADGRTTAVDQRGGIARTIVLFDLGHHNLIAESPARVESVGTFLEAQGYEVRTSTSRLDRAALAGVSLLIIVNARAERNVKEWALPTPSAFDPEEIADIRAWVRQGGGLLLVVEHMPFAGSARELAAAFDVEFINGFVFQERMLKPDNTPLPLAGAIAFSRAEGSLADHPVTNGSGAAERVNDLRLDTGSAFSVKGDAAALLRIPPGFAVLMPQRAWRFAADTPRRAATGQLQGAALQIGKGRVAVFGDSGAIMTPDLATKEKDPVSAAAAVQLFRNSLRWLHPSASQPRTPYSPRGE